MKSILKEAFNHETLVVGTRIVAFAAIYLGLITAASVIVAKAKG